MPDAIVTHRLTKHYGSRRVVNCLNLRVPAGSVYGLLGRNGAGKTTAIKMLLGLVRPDFGCVELFGENVATLPVQARRRIAYLAEGHPLYPWMTVAEIARFTRPFYPTWNQSLLDQILDHFELAGKAKLRRLSNGQRAQVSLSLAVASEPELLILDDPTLGLDTLVRRDFLESMIQIIQREVRTILLSSHILGDVERVANRIGILEDGVLRVDCPTEHFKQMVRKVVLRFAAAPPAFPPCDGLMSVRPVGTDLELVIVGWNGRHQTLVESLSPLSYEIVELNLEDAFIEYTRGQRRPMPVFVGERHHVQSTSDQGAA
ncbi:MAG: ABC transporter ATP-binding protein [Planctomycetes bacterium]|nr:ABC transporter ATP-binding protein [Planctomycetota bacterium]